MSRIAWAGELELLEAKWTDRDGHTVKFRLVTPNEDRPNPFKSFTKRKSGRAGTRFRVACSHVQGAVTGETMYDGEFMLAGWGDTSTQGYTVVFWCEAPEKGMHAFESYARTVDTFMVALVELDDDDAPVDQVKRERVETAARSEAIETAEGGEPAEVAAAVDDQRLCSCDDIMEMECSDLRTRALSPGVSCRRVTGNVAPSVRKHVEEWHKRSPRLSMYAAVMCQNTDFWAWANEQDEVPGRTWVTNKEEAAIWMRERIHISSRRELDSDAGAAERYHRMIRKPFVEWQEKEGIVV